MASQKQKKKSSGTRSTSRKKKSRQTAKPFRREAWAFVCLALAFICILGSFGLEGKLLELVGKLGRGLLGKGFFALPVALVMSFVILLMHDGRPVRLRVGCSLLLAVLVGAMAQIFSGQEGAEWGAGMLKALWLGGCEDTCGGVIAGFLAQLLAVCLSRVGAAIVLILGFVLALLTGLNMTVGGIITAIRNRPRAEYDPPKREHPDPAQTIVNHVAQKHIENTEKRRVRASDIDIPVDDPVSVPAKEPKAGKSAERPAKTAQTESGRKHASSVEEKLTEPEGFEPPVRESESQKLPEQPVQTDPSHSQYREQLESLVAEVNAAEQGLRRPMQTAAAPAEPIVQTPVQHPAASPAQTPVQHPVTSPVQTPVQTPAASSAEQTEHIPVTMPPLELPLKPSVPVQAAPAVPDVGDGPMKKAEVAQNAAEVAQQIQLQPEPAEYRFPPMELLHASSGTSQDGTEEMRQNADRLNDTLASFGIEAHIINVTRGPSVTRYELELSRGVKLSKVTNLADDIALALGSQGVRIAAIPEKISVVGIEVPNRVVSTVYARDVIDSPEFTKSKSRISFAVGKDIGGSRIIGDIGKLPHMLIAGTTGSGKSVCMNSLIISLLYKARPDEVKLIMVDPKMVELGVYNDIPHLLLPVVTDPKKAAGALQWCVTEMMRRYRSMADAGVRDLESYNKQAQAMSESDMKTMPQLVVIIDELADLMLVAAREVEESICRIAQMGRAAGIHLVIATQRPSADVITGLMKANIPSRIAFAVASAMESRIILDTSGAEKLVGKGDMLYAPLGQGKPRRVQGCFISDDEVQDIAAFVKKSNAVEYDKSVEDGIEKCVRENSKSGGASQTAAMSSDESDSDEMLPAAVEFILETGQASASMLQRRLKLGYNRAGRIIDELTEMGIVGPYEGSKPRAVLITKEQWAAMQNGGQPSDGTSAGVSAGQPEPGDLTDRQMGL